MNTEDSKAPKVSIVCAWYNRADYIKDTVDSLLNQNFDDYEVIIANDGSSDPQVKAILDSYDDPKLKVIHKKNEGFVKTIRMLIGVSRAPYVAIQGAGEISLSNRLPKQYNFLKKNQEFVAVGCAAEQIVVKGDNYVTVQSRNNYTGAITVDDLLRGNPFVHGSLMFTRTAYESIDGYRTFFKYAQDIDLLLRLSSIGKMYILEDIEYQRLIFPLDGVAVNPDKQLLQYHLASFSRTCAIHNIKNIPDLLDVYGDAGALFFKANLKLKIFNLKLFLKLLLSSDFNRAQELLKVAELPFSIVTIKLFLFVLFLSKESRLFHKFLLFVAKPFIKNSFFYNSMS